MTWNTWSCDHCGRPHRGRPSEYKLSRVPSTWIDATHTPAFGNITRPSINSYLSNTKRATWKCICTFVLSGFSMFAVRQAGIASTAARRYGELMCRRRPNRHPAWSSTAVSTSAEPRPRTSGRTRMTIQDGHVENIDFQFAPLSLTNASQNPFRGVKFEKCKASFPQDSLIQDSKCKLKDGEKSRFCPTTRFWYWGQPQPLKSGHVCGKQTACDIAQQQTKAFSDTTTNGRTTQYGSSITYNFGFEVGFEVGLGGADPAAGAAAAGARLKSRQLKDAKVRTALSFGVAKTFSQSFSRSTARTAGYTDTTGVISTIHRPGDSMDKCGAFYVVPLYQG